MRAIDLNVDLGETDSAAPSATELALLDCVTSVNLSCGAHAGNAALLAGLLAAAHERGLAIGAHPSYADRPSFGRNETGLPATGIGPLVAPQLQFLDTLASAAGATLRYVKAHGALYHRTAWDEPAAEAFARTVHAHRTSLWVLAPADSPLARWCARLGLRFAAEAFLDRGYRADGQLVPRGAPGALLHDPAAVAARAVAFATGAPIATAEGSTLSLRPDSLCAHGDSAAALPVLRAARAALSTAGCVLRAFAE